VGPNAGRKYTAGPGRQHTVKSMALVTTRQMNRAIRDAWRPEHPRRLELADPRDYSKFSFGFSKSGAVVTVKKGLIVWQIYLWTNSSKTLTESAGATGTVSEADITITDTVNDTAIYMEFVSTTATIRSVSYSGGVIPGIGMTQTGVNFPLTSWRLVNGVATLVEIHHIGVIYLPAKINWQA